MLSAAFIVYLLFALLSIWCFHGAAVSDRACCCDASPNARRRLRIGSKSIGYTQESFGYRSLHSCKVWRDAPRLMELRGWLKVWSVSVYMNVMCVCVYIHTSFLHDTAIASIFDLTCSHLRMILFLSMLLMISIIYCDMKGKSNIDLLMMTCRHRIYSTKRSVSFNKNQLKQRCKTLSFEIKLESKQSIMFSVI